jgi:hypothetical protein
MCMKIRSILFTAAATAMIAGGAGAKIIPVSSVAASSSEEREGYTFEPESVSDDRLYTFWVAGGGAGGMQDKLTFKFDGSHTVTGFEIWNGCQVNQDSFDANGRVTKVKLQVGFDEEVLDIEDQIGKQKVTFSKPYTLSKIDVFLKGVASGKSWNQIAITEIRFFDEDPDEYLSRMSASASSELEGGDYTPTNVVDSFIDSCWCEGKLGAGEDSEERKAAGQAERTSMGASKSFSQGGAGVGEWVKVDLGGKRSVSKIGIVIGDAYDSNSFRSASRPSRLDVRFSDGSSETWNLDDSPEWQFLDMGGKSISWAKFTIEEASLGKRYNDTSIGEIRVWTD